MQTQTIQMNMPKKLAIRLLGCVVLSAGSLLAQPSASTAVQQQQKEIDDLKLQITELKAK